MNTLESLNYLHVEAHVRYWEDAEVNGIPDDDGTLIPFRSGGLWRPTINLETGTVENWPAGMVAEVHYKVCDAGEYYLGERDTRVAKWNGYYVPNRFLCHGDNGFGDYIILNIDGEGRIEGWREPDVRADEWTILN